MNKLARVQDAILNQMFEHFVVLKMYHFQTKFFGAHKASDSYLEGFLGHFDRLLEVSQGNFKTTAAKSISVEAQMVTDLNVENYLDGFLDFLNSFEKLLGKGTYHDLYAIRDEMVAEVNKLKYLLRFK